MATLLELYTIETSATADPTDPAARDLRAKVRSAVLKRAGTILAQPLPAGEGRAEALEQLSWAQRAVASPEAPTAAVFRLVLSRAAPGATTAQILAATDQVIEDAITPVLAMLAKGLHPGG
jgi:hypothetical protein